MRRWAPIALALALLVAEGAATVAQQASAPKLTSEEYAVYAAVIERVYPQGKAPLLLIEEKTSVGLPPGLVGLTQMQDKTMSDLRKAVEKETLDDYEAKNKQSAQIERQLKISSKYVLLQKKEEDELFKRAGGYQALRKKYPESSGITLLSRVGFNRAGTQALVYTGSSCGVLCGDGYFVLLQKEDSAWKVLYRGLVWVS